MVELTPKQLKLISQRTVGHYDNRAEDFFEGTKDHDVSQNINTLLEFIQAQKPFRILDLGCGPGRDLLALTELGHLPTGLEGSANFCKMARAYSGCEVLHQDFLALTLPDTFFDGVFANASLFHIPLQELPRVLGELRNSLKPNGVLFASNPRGPNTEGYNGERFGSYHDWEAWKSLCTQAGFNLLTHYYRPAGLPRDQQPWLASAWRKCST